MNGIESINVFSLQLWSVYEILEEKKTMKRCYRIDKIILDNVDDELTIIYSMSVKLVV